MLFKLRRFLIYLVASIVILLALSQGVVRLALPLANEQRQRIALELGELLQSQVSIGQIDSHWRWFVPYIDLIDVEIRQLPDSASADQAIGRLSIGVNAIDMFRSGSLLPSSLQLERVTINLRQKEQGGYYLPGIAPRTNPDSERAEIDWAALTQHKRIALRDTRIILSSDRRLKGVKALTISPLEIDIHTGNSRYTGEVRWQLPSFVGEPSRIAFDLTGQWGEPLSWLGDIDVDIPAQKLASLQPYLPPGAGIEKGHIGLQAGFSMTSEGVVSKPGKLDLAVDFVKGGRLNWISPIEISGQDGQLQLAMTQSLKVGDQALDMLQNLALTFDWSEQWSAALSVAQLDFKHLADLLNRAASLPDPWDKRVRGMSPEGALKDLSLGWSVSEGVYASGHVALDKLAAIDGLPGVSNLALDFKWEKSVLDVDIDQRDLVYDGRPLFREPIPLDWLKTSLKVYRDEDTTVLSLPSLFLYTPDLKLHSAFEMRFAPDKRPFMRLYVTGENANIAMASRYMPAGIMKKGNTLQWLDNALVGGTIRDFDAHIEGHFGELFDKSKGIFRIDADIEDARFRYLKTWPELNKVDARFWMDGFSLGVDASEAYTYDIRVAPAKAYIPTVKKTRLYLDLNARQAPLNSLLRFVRESDLKKTVGAAADILKGQGHANLDFSLDFELSRHFPEPRRRDFKGLVTLADSTLNIPLLDLELGALKGQVAFTHNTVDIEGMTGTANGEAIAINADTRQVSQRPRAFLQMQGRYAPATLLKDKLRFLTDQMQGSSDWLTTLEIPLAKGGQSPVLYSESDLVGLGINLPAPLYKSAEQAAAGRVSLVLNKALSNQVRFEYGEQLKAVLVLAEQGLERGRINIGKGLPAVPTESGLLLDASLDSFEVDPWLNFIQQQTAEGGGSESQGIRGILLAAKELNFKGQQIKQAQTAIAPYREQDVSGWQININSEAVQGNVRLFPESDLPMQVVLDFFDMDDLVEQPGLASEEASSATDVPDMDIQVASFKWEGIRLNNIQGQIRQTETGQALLENLSVEQPHLKVNGNGSWTTTDQQQTKVAFTVDTDNAGQALAALGLPDVMQNGKGSLVVDLSWSGEPWRYNAATLMGTMGINLEDGALVSVDPGAAGRLVGLLSVQALPKRLALDFSNLSSQGLAYNRIRGGSRIEQGILYQDGTEIKADFGRINLQGQTDLVKKEVNQIATIIPDISNTVLPVAAGVLGGVPGLLGSVVVDRLVKLLGGDTDSVAQVRYHIKGPWDNPETERAKVKHIKDLTEDELRQRAESIVKERTELEIEPDAALERYESLDEVSLDDDAEAVLFEGEE